MADTDKMYTSVAAEKKKMQLLKGELDALDGSKADKATVAAGSYNKVTVNSQGVVTAGENPTTLAGYGIQDAYTKTEVNGLVDTPHQNYVTVQATDQTTDATDVLPASGQAATDTIYRVSNWDGSANSFAGAFDVTVYSEYAWDDISNPNKYVFLAVRPAIGEVFDISVYNNNATYPDLASALGANGANVPAEIRRGGMSIKFVQSSDNNYVKFRYMSSSTAVADFTNVANLQGVDEKPTAGSKNIVESGGSALSISKAIATLTGIYLINTEEGVYYGDDNNKHKLNVFSINFYGLYNVQSVHVKARIGSSAYILFFDEDNNVLSSYQGNDGSGINVDIDINVPQTCAYFGVSYSNAYPCEVTSVSVIGKITKELNEVSAIANQNSEDLYGVVLVNTEEGAYLNSEGKIIGNVPSHSINYYTFDTQNVSSIHIKARIGPVAYIMFYDENENILSSYHGNNNEGINIDADYTVPEGCTHFGVSYSNSYPCEVNTNNNGLIGDVNNIKKWIDEQSSLDIKIGLLGDSIAAGASASTGKGFINIAASILGATVKNAAIYGWYLGDYESKSIYKQVNGVSPATTSLDGDEDLIIIFAGTNDFGHAFPIGVPYTIDSNGHKTPSTDETTTCGGLVKTIQTLYTKYNGYIPIIICTPLQRSLAGGSSSGGSWDKNNIDKYMEDYIDAIYSVANYYGIPVADFYHNNMNPNVAAANTLYFVDGLHPNTEGHRLIGTRLAKIIKDTYIL